MLALFPVALMLVDPGFVRQFCHASILALVPEVGQGVVLAVESESLPHNVS